MSFWKPGENVPITGKEDREIETEENFVVNNPHSLLTIEQQRESLPINKKRREILYLMETNRIVIIVGETGCGKTTQIPQYLYEAGWSENGKKIACTQPRRVATISVATRVAEEMGVQLGSLVGYSIRFDEKSDKELTKIRYMTDGMLLREMMINPLLEDYSVVMVDEAHERTLHSDILLGLLKRVLKKNKNLKLIISSATLDADSFFAYFNTRKKVKIKKIYKSEDSQNSNLNEKSNDNLNEKSNQNQNSNQNLNENLDGNLNQNSNQNLNGNLNQNLKENLNEIQNQIVVSTTFQNTATIISIEGRLFPVEIFYLQSPTNDYMESSLNTIIKINETQPPGDVLVFLTGQEEVETLAAQIKETINEQKKQKSRHSRNKLKLLPLPMYAFLPLEEQRKVFNRTPPGFRKIVISTNVAETSITIPGIVYVVDCGFMKIRAYDPQIEIESLCIVPISKSNAQQRAGRAGRICEGKCFRLYTEQSYRESFRDSEIPEIQRSNFASVILQLQSMGIDDLAGYEFLSPPPTESLARGLELLFSLGAIDHNGDLTQLGEQMAEFPVNPMIAKMLLESAKFGCSEEILTIASMVSVQSVFYNNPERNSAIEKAKRKFAVYEGDHITFLNVYNEFIRKKKNGDWCKSMYLNYKALLRAEQIRNQLKAYMRRFKIPLVSIFSKIKNAIPFKEYSYQEEVEVERQLNQNEKTEAVKSILKCIVSGFFANAAKLHIDGTYRRIRGNQVLSIHPTSVLFKQEPPQFVVYNETVLTSKIFMRDLIQVDPEWLSDLAPHFYEYKKPQFTQERSDSGIHKKRSLL